MFISVMLIKTTLGLLYSILHGVGVNFTP